MVIWSSWLLAWLPLLSGPQVDDKHGQHGPGGRMKTKPRRVSCLKRLGEFNLCILVNKIISFLF